MFKFFPIAFKVNFQIKERLKIEEKDNFYV
jgi:hypothetical protein